MPAQTIETITREDAVVRLRRALLQTTDEETSMCKVAAERGFFCRGFQQFGDKELRRRYDWIVRKRPELSRDELEKIANDWQLAQQEVNDLPFACDVQAKVHDTCGGWDDFTNEELADFYKQVSGREVRIVVS